MTTPGRCFDDALMKMRGYVAHAGQMAAALARLPGVRIVPPVPLTNLFHVVVDGDPAAAAVVRDAVADELGVMPFRAPQPGPLPGTWKVELYIGDAAMQVGVEEAAQVWGEVVRRLG